VRDAVDVLLAAEKDYLAWRLGARPPQLPQRPVIPLGVHTADFASDAADRARARAALGVGEDVTLVLFVGRLSFHAKAHPHAMYQALQRVAERTGRPVTLLQCGYVAAERIGEAFRTGAATFCPDVPVLFTDGRDPAARSDAFAAADIFMSLSDNHQETFGLTPLEAMAAGLPVIITDWDGYRDTVRDGVDGFRIPPFAPAPDIASGLDVDHATGLLTYDRYLGNACMTVSVDHEHLAACLTQLVEEPHLAQRMGEAGRRRAQADFDWSVIHCRYRSLFGDLAASRRAEAAHVAAARPRPSRADPFTIYSGYPTHHVGPATVVAARGTLATWRRIAEHDLFRFAETLARDGEVEQVLGVLAEGPADVETLVTRCCMAPSRGRLVVCHLLKAGVLAVVPCADER
jgi:hypothetical protein